MAKPDEIGTVNLSFTGRGSASSNEPTVAPTNARRGDTKIWTPANPKRKPETVPSKVLLGLKGRGLLPARLPTMLEAPSRSGRTAMAAKPTGRGVERSESLGQSRLEVG